LEEEARLEQYMQQMAEQQMAAEERTLSLTSELTALREDLADHEVANIKICNPDPNPNPNP